MARAKAKVAAPPPPPITPRPAPPNPADVKAQYGFVAQLASQVPEINSILDRATRESWTSDRFSMEVANTSWWKTTPNETRQWIIQQIADPATANQALGDGANQVKTLAAQLGFTNNVTDDATARDIWLYSKLHGFNDTQTKSRIYELIAPRTNAYSDISGEYGAVLNQMRELSANYGYAMTPGGDAELKAWAQSNAGQAGGGSGPIAGWESKMKNFAVTKYAGFADRIRGGETVKDIAEPFVQSYQKLLEQPPTQGFRDPMIEKALQGQLVDGKATTPTIWQFEQQMRSDPRWAVTQNARQSVAQTLNAIGKTFGMVG